MAKVIYPWLLSFDAILPYAVVPDAPGIYVCGCLERWVSIQLQAVRALNLAWALRSDGLVAPGARVCVIGGGFAGLTVAARLARGGARVTLLEQNVALLGAQRGNRVRWIHPHIHEWPRAGAMDPRAGLPLLDWTAALSADVAAAVLTGFEGEVHRSAIDVVLGARPVVLAAGPMVSWRGGAAEPFAVVVLALGVGVEKSFGELPLRSYWADDDIATIKDGPARHHLVTGIGEGGVIDALYLRLGSFSHAELARELEASAGMRDVEAALLHVEREIAGLADDHANLLLDARYRALPVPVAVDDKLRARARRDTRVTLNGPEPHPLAPRADVLNRFLISRLVALGVIDYLPGKVASIVVDGPGYRAEIDGASHVFDEVNIRHGTVPAMRAAFPDLWSRYQPARMRLPHLTPEPFWPPGFFDA